MTASLSGVYNLQVLTSTGAPAALYRLYTYTQGTTTHKAAYTDAAGSVAHTYTSDGAGGQFIALNSRGELPAPLFLTSGAYDLCLKDSAGSTVWTRYAKGSDDVGNAAVADLASTSDTAKGDALIGVKSTLTGAVARTQHARNEEDVRVTDFGAGPSASAADNLTGIAAAVASGAKIIRFPGGTYSLGTLNASATSFAVTADGIRFVADGAVTFSFAYGANSTQPIIFGFTGSDNIRFDGTFKFVDSVGYNGTTIHGVKAFKLNDDCTNFVWEDLHFSGCLSGIEVRGTADSRSCFGLRAKIKASAVYYVVNHIQNGDDAIYDIHATNCRREYFNYGARGHKVKLTLIDKNTGGTSLIESYEVYTNPTEVIDLDIDAYFTGTPSIPILFIQHAPTTSSGITPGIKNINVRYNVVAGSAAVNTSLGAIHLSATVNGGSAITSNCNCTTDQINFFGSTNGNYVYDVYSEYTLTSGNTKGRSFWPYNCKPNVNTVKILTPAKSFTWSPTISGSGWAIGNGTVEGNYTIVDEGQILQVWGKITFGSTSTYGAAAALLVELPALAYRWAGEGSFASGHPSTLTMVGMANVFDTSASTYYQIPVKTGDVTGSIYLAFHGVGTTGYVTGTTPFTFATGDVIQFEARLVRNNMGATAP